MALDQYSSVTAESPCPKCGRPDWCATHYTGRKVLCMRVPGGRPACGGWIHYVAPGILKPTTMNAQPKTYLTSEQVKEYLQRSVSFHQQDANYVRLCQLLQLSALSVWKMGGGYDRDSASLAFLMFDAEHFPVGIRFRRRDGKKWSLKGGREGVFMSGSFWAADPVYIAEGPTDSAALIEAGFDNVLGRPNCTGGVKIIQGLLCDYPKTPVVVLADPDDPGIAGAERLAVSLPNPTIVLTGPCDIRSYVTRFPNRREAAVGILDGIYTPGAWREISRNNSGRLFNFTTLSRSTE